MAHATPIERARDLARTTAVRPARAALERPTFRAPAPVLLLLAGLAATAAAQGGYHATGQALAAAFLLAALLASRAAGRLTRSELTAPPLAAAAALGAWAVISAGLAGNSRQALPVVGLLAGVGAILVITRRLPATARRSLAWGTVGMGAVVALTGWVGVAFRLSPWALESSGLWRAATTLTYANAAAGLLVPLALVALALLVEHPRSGWAATAAVVLVVGAVATISRFGILTLVLGGAALAGLLGGRRVLVATAPAFLGAGVALLALLPSVPGSHRPLPLLAAIGLAAGVGCAVAARRLPARWSGRRLVALALVGGAMACLAVVVLVLVPAVQRFKADRLTLASPARTRETLAALHLAATRPFTGVGPGNAQLVWTNLNGVQLYDAYVHDEYLQTLAELGSVGTGLLLVLLVGLAGVVARGKGRAPSPELWAGIVAALAAFALHSGADFLWHIPVLPFTAALLIGLTAPSLPDQAVGLAGSRSTPTTEVEQP